MRNFVLIAFLFFIINCQSIRPMQNLDPDFGDIEGNLYESSKGKFVCYIPVDARNATMDDGKFKVSFFQKGLGLFKIQAIKSTLEFKENLEKIGKEKALQAFVETNLVSKVAKSRPGSRIDISEYYPELRQGLYFFIIQIPNESAPQNESQVSFSEYAMMSFVSGDFIYLITRDLSTLNDSQEKIAEAQRRLIDFHSRIVILGDQVASDLDLDAFDKEADEETEEDEEEELGGGGAGGSLGAIDLSGILKILQKRLYTPKGKFDIKPGRFKLNTNRFNSNKFKMSGRTHISPGRFKMKSSFKSPRFKR